MSTFSIDQAQKIAISAVHQAAKIASKVQYSIIQEEAVTKVDKSPVTIADYTCQLLISILLLKHFPSIPIIGEESSDSLKTEKKTLDQVVKLFNEGLSSPKEEPGLWEGLCEGEKSEAEVLELLDRGGGEGGREGLFWALDPIDGTKGFLRRGQYAVCLGLLQAGKPVMGVIGCPNLPVDYHEPTGELGVIFVAQKGKGALQRPLSSSSLSPINFSPLSSMSSASFCESVESGHSDQSTNARIASLLGIKKPSVRMDSQAKYCSIARGDGDVYLRLPVSATYEEKIWDHAAGNIIVTEAGGMVSDIHGKELDFGVGRTLRDNKGVIACQKEWGPTVLEAVKKALGEKEAK